MARSLPAKSPYLKCPKCGAAIRAMVACRAIDEYEVCEDGMIDSRVDIAVISSPDDLYYFACIHSDCGWGSERKPLEEEPPQEGHHGANEV